MAKHIEDLLKNRSFSVFTADNPNGKQASEEDNTKSLAKLHGELMSRGVEFYPHKKNENGLSFADGGPVPGAAATANSAPADTIIDGESPTVPVYDISGQQPVLGDMPHEDLHGALASGRYALPQGVRLPVKGPDGSINTIDASEAHEALNNGYSYALPHEVDEAQYGTGDQQAATVAEGLASGIFSRPLVSAAEQGLGITTGKAIRGRQRTNPWESGISEGAGLLGGALTGTGEAAVLGKAGSLVDGLGLTSKVGSAVLKGAVENGIYQAGEEVGKLINDDPDQSLGSVTAHVGLASLLGGGIGGVATGVVSPLWEAAAGSKTAQFLSGLVKRAGGIEGAPVADDVTELLDRAGIKMDPEIRAGLSEDPTVKNMFRTLNQSDSTFSGQNFQQAYGKFRQDLSNHLINVLGQSPEEVAKLPAELSKYQYGKTIGHTLADEWDAQVSPLTKEYDDLAAKYSGADISPSVGTKQQALSAALDKANNNLTKLTNKALRAQKTGNPELLIELSTQVKDAQDTIKNLHAQMNAPGTADILSDRIANLANREGWSVSPSSDIMREVARVQKELPNLKNLKDLTNYVKAVGDNMQSDPLNGPLRRAGGMIKSLLRDEESRIIGNHIGGEEGVEALERYQNVRQAYYEQSQLREALDSRLHAKGSTSGYGKSLREMAQTDGESVVRRLSGTGDADILDVLQKNFPKTAEAVKQFHIATALKGAAEKAGEKESISASKLIDSIGKMSPEVRNFAIPKAAQDRIGAVSEILDKLKDPTHNFSNTARVLDKLFSSMPGSGLGVISMLTGHGAATSLLAGAATQFLGREMPDAARLSLLKFLGSSGEVNASGFKAMAEYIHSIAKGENLMNKAAKGVFKAESEVVPAHLMPDDTSRAKLDAKVQQMQEKPENMLKVAKDLGHYMPEHAQAAGTMVASSVNYLNSIRPNGGGGLALDAKLKPNAVAQAKYNRALDIAEQPLVAVKALKEGQLTVDDVVTLKTVNPGAYQRISQKLMAEMTDHINKGNVVPYRTRLGLATFLGQPLDSTMTPIGIQGAQPMPPQPQQATATTPKSGAKSSTSKLGNMAKASATLAQSREGRQREG
jgi:hypothetical protein